jgi:hypothetical protein
MKADKNYSDLPPEQLEQIAARFEREFVPTRPLTPKMVAADRRSKRKVGRPRVGLGAEKIRVSVEKRLLREADSFAKERGLSRSELISKSLRAVLAVAS